MPVFSRCAWLIPAQNQVSHLRASTPSHACRHPYYPSNSAAVAGVVDLGGPALVPTWRGPWRANRFVAGCAASFSRIRLGHLRPAGTGDVADPGRALLAGPALGPDFHADARLADDDGVVAVVGGAAIDSKKSSSGSDEPKLDPARVARRSSGDDG